MRIFESLFGIMPGNQLFSYLIDTWYREKIPQLFSIKQKLGDFAG
jgi:hypothetical protein